MSRPALSFQLGTRQEQRMLLLPRMLQSIEVLQLPAMELEGFLRSAFEENEALVLDEPRAPLPSSGAGQESSERFQDWMQNQPARARGLQEELEEQLALLELPELEQRWVRFLIGCLDASGYLSPSDETLLGLAEQEGLDGGMDGLARAIATLQRFEPRGIGGRDAVEALLLQLDPRDPDYAPLCELIEDFLDELARNKRPAIARAMGLGLEDLELLIERLRELDPRPAAELSDERERPIVPDVVIELVPAGEGDDDGGRAAGPPERTGGPAKSDDFECGYRLRVDQSGLPNVSIDPRISELASDRGQDGELRKYLKEKLEQARWVLDAVEQRKATLLRIAQRTFEHQAEFLADGPGHLRPLRMADVAEGLELHPSTVSRAVAGKWVETPWGVFPLRHFFQAPSNDSGAVARGDVRERVREIIDAEDPREPLADEDVVAALAKSGLDVARRTVAKYRKELGIPSSYRRRKFG